MDSFEKNIFGKYTLSTSVDFDTRVPGGYLVSAPAMNQDFADGTAAEQHPVPETNGYQTPLTARILTEFDPKTGYQMVDSDGYVVKVESPVAAAGVILAAHGP